MSDQRCPTCNHLAHELGDENGAQHYICEDDFHDKPCGCPECSDVEVVGGGVDGHAGASSRHMR